MKKFILLAFIFTFLLFNSCEDNIKYKVDIDEPEEVTFTEVKQIFTNNGTCTSCHNTQSKDYYAGLDLSANTYDNIVGVSSTQRPNELLIKANSLEESYLYRKMINEDVDGSVMPTSGKLNQIQIDKIKTWIENGALNN